MALFRLSAARCLEVQVSGVTKKNYNKITVLIKIIFFRRLYNTRAVSDK